MTNYGMTKAKEGYKLGTIWAHMLIKRNGTYIRYNSFDDIQAA